MKRLILILLLFSGSFVFAQKADSITKLPKAKNIDGTLMSPAKNLVDNISSSPELSTLVKAIEAAGLADSLRAGTITLFAPANQAFDKLAPGTLDTLLKPEHRNELINLINNHLVRGRFTSKDIASRIRAGNGQAAFITFGGSTLTARINENRNIALTDENGDQGIITRLDIEQSNGMLFLINAVLQPKAKQ